MRLASAGANAGKFKALPDARARATLSFAGLGGMPRARLVLRMAHCDWYKRAMGMQGSGTQAPRERTIDPIWAGKGRGINSALVLAVFGLMPVLAACSSFSSSSSSATTSAPATYQPASAPANAAAAPASDATASIAPYPSRSLVDVFSDNSRPAATGTTSSAPAAAPASSAAYAPPRPGMPHPPSTYTASAPPYQGQPGYDAYAGSSGAQPKPAPVAAQDDSETEVPGYASKSLLDVFH